MATKINPPDLDTVDIYFEYLDAVHEFFGYDEDWKVIPLEDGREYYWTLYLDNPKDPKSDGCLRYHEDREALMNKEAGEYYEATILDGNKFLIILDNDKEVKDPEPYKSFIFPEG